MGLLTLLQQGKTTLSAGSFPGDSPINDPQSGFIQNNSPENTYEDEYIGVNEWENTNTLYNSLNETAFDNSTDSQPTTPYGYAPQSERATGTFRRYALPYTARYLSSRLYLDQYLYDSPFSFIESEPTLFNYWESGIPIYNLLRNTGLDNSNFTSLWNWTPIDNPTNYSNLATGEFRGPSNNYEITFSPNNTYTNAYINDITNFDTLQTATLSETGLDNTLPNSSAPTTTNPSFYTQYFSQFNTGKFGGASQQFIPMWNSNGEYVLYYNPNVQIDTLSQTGLDNTNEGLSPTTQQPQSVPVTPQILPNQTFMGEFGGAPNQFSSIYSPNQGYLNNYNTIINENSNPQVNTLTETGLDTTNLEYAPTTTPPQQVPPTPQLLPPQTFMGEFQGAPNQYIQSYTPTQGYLNNYNTVISNAGNPQILNLNNTGLDIENQNAAPTAYVVPFIDNTNYPALATGELNSAPTFYSQNYTPLTTYNNLVANTPQGPYSILEQSLSQTGLDIENTEAAPTTYVVPTTDNTSYPSNATGEYNGPALPYEQTYSSTPGSTYEDFVINTVNGPTSIVENSLAYTGLDIENTEAAPTTYVVPQTDNNTIYPVDATGFENLPASPYTQIWKPTNRYYDKTSTLRDEDKI